MEGLLLMLLQILLVHLKTDHQVVDDTNDILAESVHRGFHLLHSRTGFATGLNKLSAAQDQIVIFSDSFVHIGVIQSGIDRNHFSVAAYVLDVIFYILSNGNTGVQLKDGRLLYVGKSGDADHKNLGAGVGKIVAAESTDRGKSWRVIGELPFPEQISVLRFCHEPHAVETADGRIVALTRSHYKEDGFLGSIQSESTDGGKTWTMAKRVGIDGYPPHLIRLKDGKLLAVYGRRWNDFGEYACLSDDNGRTWDVRNEIKLAGHWNGDLGYPASVQLPDGTILTVYYQTENKGEKTCLMGWYNTHLSKDQ